MEIAGVSHEQMMIRIAIPDELCMHAWSRTRHEEFLRMTKDVEH